MIQDDVIVTEKECKCPEGDFDLQVYGNHFCKNGIRIPPDEMVWFDEEEIKKTNE